MNRLFTMFAFFLTALAAVVLFYIVFPVSYDGLGKLGTIALLFTPQLIMIAMITSGLAFWAWHKDAGLIAVALSITTLLFLGIGIWAHGTLWRYARQHEVSVDFAKALAPKLNRGKEQAEQTAVYDESLNLSLDVWPTKQNGSLHPAIFRIHGGAWNHGERSEMAEWNKWLNELGYTVFDIDYRLAPSPHWQDSLNDVIHAIDWVKQHAGAYGIDPTRINLMGYSAGGHLAMLAGYSINTPVRTVINLYGAFGIEIRLLQFVGVNHIEAHLY